MTLFKNHFITKHYLAENFANSVDNNLTLYQPCKTVFTIWLDCVGLLEFPNAVWKFGNTEINKSWTVILCCAKFSVAIFPESSGLLQMPGLFLAGSHGKKFQK